MGLKKKSDSPSLVNNAYAKYTRRKTRDSHIYGQKHYHVVYVVSAQIEDPETCGE